MKVKEISTPDPECISPVATLSEAARKMRLLDVGILLVREQERLVGTVTDRDITVRAVAEGLDPKVARVRQVMTRGVVCCYEDRTVEEAARLMEDRQIRRLPVVDEEKHLVGIVSITDLAIRAHNESLAGQVLECVAGRPHAHVRDFH
jgi:CBS domain-containing protein